MHCGGLSVLYLCGKFICQAQIYCTSTTNHDVCLEFMNIQFWAALSTRLSWDTVHGSIICWNKLVCQRKMFWTILDVLGKELAKPAIRFPSWGTGFENKIWQVWSLPHYVSQSAFVAFPFLKRWGCAVFSMQCWENRTLCQLAPYFWLFLNLLKSSRFLL